MSIDLCLTRADGTEDSISVCGQRTATEFFGRLAHQHEFCILTGLYPVWVTEADLDQLLNELSIIRAASKADLADNPHFAPDDRTYIDEQWRRVIEFIEPLALERGWMISIG